MSETRHHACAIPTEAAHGVPNLQFYLLGIDVDHPGSELNSDRQIVHRLEPFVRELQQQA